MNVPSILTIISGYRSGKSYFHALKGKDFGPATSVGSSQANLFLLRCFMTGILLLPVWVRLAHRFGKKNMGGIHGDWQLARFKANPGNRGRVMDHGLWAWNRHPNYFGEFLIWWGFFLVALAAPGGWWTVVSPVIISMVLLKMTGVPLTEAALKARRPGYKDYIRRTSAFFPRPPKRATGETTDRSR